MFPFLIPPNTIMIWHLDQVPAELMSYLNYNVDMSTVHWVAFVPNQMDNQYISWLQSSSFTSDGGPQKIHVGYGSLYLGRNPL